MCKFSAPQMDEEPENVQIGYELPENVESVMEPPDEEDDEDADADFNPFQKEVLSPEPSSSLSSDIEERDLVGEVTESGAEDLRDWEDDFTLRVSQVVEDQGSQKQDNGAYVSESDVEVVRGNETGVSSGTDAVNGGDDGELRDGGGARNPIMDSDEHDDDAICKRTRAQYSLASFTLDELETFLQESDDDEDAPNVDDEEEYRKFLSAVLMGGDGERKGDQENVIVDDDDDDEDNDADFEIEIEEALESDVEEGVRSDEQKEAGRRPETRQNKCGKASSKKDNKRLPNTQRPLLPLVPGMPSGPLTHFASIDRPTAQPCFPSSTANGVMYGFTPQQLGQLHCLLYEHIQLLIQVFTLSIFDPAKQHIASDVQGLLMDLLEKRNQALSSRRVPYPYFCFLPPYAHPSVPCELPKAWPIPCASVDSLSLGPSGFSLPSSSNSVPSAGERLCDKAPERSLQKKERFFWVPSISGPIFSILDAVPLRIVGEYINDLKIAIREYKQRLLRETSDSRFDRESMFPNFLNPVQISTNRTIGSVSASGGGPSKKSFAASLVESAKNQPIALVPKAIGTVAQRFCPIFNPALYPRKPPPVVIANKVLFTGAEDELLALGIMEYNTDWKAIQQRFLPCKTKHQIFVRQKNCCSAKASENPIKAVRRMKVSPLTENEIEHIREGLRVYKLDWFSVWKFVVPYRDPSMLARQWRIALGTQKSYKHPTSEKEKRRVYEAKRRRNKSELAENRSRFGKKDDCNPGDNSADDSIENEGEAFVHEAFLADWRPGASSLSSSRPQYLDLRGKSGPVDSSAQAYHSELPDMQLPVNSRGNNGNSLAAFRSLQQPSMHMPLAPSVNNSTPDVMQMKYPVSDATSKASRSIYWRPYRARRFKSKTVKLAPTLPPLNLPSSARVISQAAFQIYQSGSSAKVGASVNGRISKVTSDCVCSTGASTSCQNKNTTRQSSLAEQSREVGEEAGLEMHPLLFQSSGDQSGLAYHPLKLTSGAPSAFSFFSERQPLVDLSAFRQAQDTTTTSLFKTYKPVETSSASGGIDFHPLLQKPNDGDNSSRKASSPAQPSIMSPIPSSPHEKAQELNLEMQLSSLPKDQRVQELVDRAGNKTTAAVATASETASRQNPPTIHAETGMSFHFFLDPSEDAGKYTMDDAGERSLDIVMEQEELSDSDEDNEIEEDVEFECEEMEDSEPDAESDQETAVQTRNKVPVTSGRRSVADSSGEESSLAEGSIHPFLTLSSAGIAEYPQAKNSPLLTLNSNPPPSRTGRKTLDKEKKAQPVASRPSKRKAPSRKKDKGTTAKASTVNLLEQLSMSTTTNSHPKKPRKRVCRPKLNLNALPDDIVNSD